MAEGPITVSLSLPAGCTVANESKLDVTNNTVTQLFEGLRKPKEGGKSKDLGGIQAQGGYAANTWGALLTQLGVTFATSLPKEALTRHVAGASESVEVQSLEEVEKGEGPKTITVNNQEKVNSHGWRLRSGNCRERPFGRIWHHLCVQELSGAYKSRSLGRIRQRLRAVADE